MFWRDLLKLSCRAKTELRSRFLITFAVVNVLRKELQ
jgi:hypothetical protein